jgi:tRNA threonylcarbamoyladenosine biosynthesis protein TsaE
LSHSILKANCPCKGDLSADASAGKSTAAVTKSYEETFNFGLLLGRALRPGDVVSLDGGLGAGKTCLCAGICRALGVREPVTSPTYTIVHEYEGWVPVYHIDAYRISGAEDFEASCGSEILGGENVSLIEWGGRMAASLPQNTIHVEIKILDGGTREIVVSGIADFQVEN